MRNTILIAVTLLVASPALAVVTICGSAGNDLVVALPGDQVRRVDTPAEAIDRATDGSAVLVLADEYPAKQVKLPGDFYDRAAQKHLRVYVEYPSAIPGAERLAAAKLGRDAQATLELKGPPRTTAWERGVIASDCFAPELKKLHIVAPHDCHFLVANAANPDLVVARVAGYDSAVYGLPKETFPLLFGVGDGRVIIATTKLSGFVTARFGPSEDWKIIWRGILKKLDPDHEPPALNVKPSVWPAYGASEKAPAALERETFDRAAAFYTHARLLIGAKRQAAIHQLLANGVENCEPPAADVEGDGSLGMIEGYGSQIRFDGSQPQRTPIRSDCNAEAAMVLSFADDAKDKKIGANLLDYVFGPEMESMGRSDPKHPAFGMIAWGAISPAWAIGNYGDDDARVILSTLLASATQKTDRWNEPVMRALLGNLRTTGTLGFRGDRVDIGPLEQFGWKHFHDAATVNPAPHFESYLWACNLWAYRATGEKEFLDRTSTAMRMTMEAYGKKQWRWNDNIERARMLLCLSWLDRLEDSPEHRQWLMTVATDLLQFQQPCGAIRETLGGFAPPASNEAYGQSETSLMQTADDPASDQLYTTGFALLGLHEAVAATHDAKLQAAEDKLAEFLCRIQVRSEKIPYIDGGWFRAFDDRRWDYWASSADAGWGAWAVEAGWGQAWIAATLKLRERRTTFWDATANSTIREKLAGVRELMAENDGSPLKKG